MDVSVCIVNWNTRELLERCLQSIFGHTTGLRFEVIVVDNASSDRSAEMVADSFPRVRLIASPDNLGFARGSNLAASAALGDYILYLNPDTELVTDAIAGMWNFLRSNPSHGAVGCQLLNSDLSIQLTCAGSFPSPSNELSSLLGLDRMFPRSRFFSSRELNYWDHADSRDVECLSGACMMIARGLARDTGGFDENHFMYGEDLDLCCRVRREGWRLRYLADEVVLHHEGAASRKRGRSFAPLLQRAANYYFLRKNFGPATALAYRGAVWFGSGVRIVGAVALAPWWVARPRPIGWSLPHFLARHADLFLWASGLKGMPTR